MDYRPVFTNKLFVFALLLIGSWWLACCKNEDPNIKMFEAIKNVDIEGVKESIEDGAQKNALNKSGEHAFHVALKTGNRDLIEALIRSGFNLNIPDTLGFTPIFRCHDPTILKILLSAGASVDITDAIDQKTPLMLAERADCASTLIQHSPDILDKQDKSGKTALMYAIESNKSRVIDTLLKYDARVDIIDNEGKNSMDYTSQDKLLNRLKEKDKIQNTEIKSIIDYANSNSVIPARNYKYREKFTIPPYTYKLIVHYETTPEMSIDFLEFANKVTQIITPTGQLIELADKILAKFHTKTERKSETGTQSIKYYLTTPSNAEVWHRIPTISFEKQQKLEDFSLESRDCKIQETHEWLVDTVSDKPRELSICLDRCEDLSVLTSSCNIRIGVIAYVFQPKKKPTQQVETMLRLPNHTRLRNICTMGGKSAHIRNKPSLSGKKIGLVTKGETLEYFEKTQAVALPNGQSNGAWPWVKIQTQKGKTGWVYGEFLLFDE